LKCRYCGPTDSASWYDDYVKLNFASKVTTPTLDYCETIYEFAKKGDAWAIKSDEFNWPEDSQLIHKLMEDIQYVERFYFTGGEPTLIKSHWDLLQRCIDAGRAGEIYLEYKFKFKLRT
jgi:organic radical activating enzyme